jgi:hypothetical protein
MSNTRTIILIWGGAIILYLAISRASGTSSVVSSLSGMVTNVTKTLQAR